MPLDKDARAEELAAAVVDAAIKVHKALGPGLLESVYEACLAHELGLRGIPVKRQLVLPVTYEGMTLETGLRIDMLAGDCVIVELKSVDTLLPVHQSQLITYLKLSGLNLGLLINFNVRMLRDGLKRIVL
ncbi:MAG: GxxExxY protein [Rhodocyclaceae bacterium]|nr:GxxExxY protein [Rhodocyclaceae bacterium]